jgi:maltose O-acetyltransferase
VPINQSGFKSAEIVIGKNVWISAGAVILKGVSIGAGAVVAANAVVVRSVVELDIVGGIPANVIGNREIPATGHRFQRNKKESS